MALRWIGVFVLCVAFSLGAGSCSDSCSNEVSSLEQGDAGVKLMSFNIRYGSANDGDNHWNKRKGLVLDVVKDSDAAVIGLQEALKFQIDAILASADNYASVGVAREDGKSDGEFSNVLYDKRRFKLGESGTFWLSDTPEKPGSITWGNACTRICSWVHLTEKGSDRSFYVYNAHLDHRSQPSRQKSVALIAKRIAARTHKDDPFVLMGDFNAGEDNGAVQYLKGAADATRDKTPLVMVDTFRVLHPDADEVGTFNGFKGRSNGDKIDYIFASDGDKVLNAGILRTNSDGRYPSDHFPVTAEMGW